MSYVPDPYDPTQPVGSVKARTAAAEFRALKDASALIGKSNLFERSQSVNRVDLDSDTVIPINAELGNIFYLELAHNATLENPTNLLSGQVITLIIENTGSYTLAFDTFYLWSGGAAPTITPNGLDVISMVYTSSQLFCNAIQDFQ